jgi:hypothetical protein
MLLILRRATSADPDTRTYGRGAEVSWWPPILVSPPVCGMEGAYARRMRHATMLGMPTPASCLCLWVAVRWATTAGLPSGGAPMLGIRIALGSYESSRVQIV